MPERKMALFVPSGSCMTSMLLSVSVQINHMTGTMFCAGILTQSVGRKRCHMGRLHEA